MAVQKALLEDLKCHFLAQRHFVDILLLFLLLQQALLFPIIVAIELAHLLACIVFMLQVLGVDIHA